MTMVMSIGTGRVFGKERRSVQAKVRLNKGKINVLCDVLSFRGDVVAVNRPVREFGFVTETAEFVKRIDGKHYKQLSASDKATLERLLAK